MSIPTLDPLNESRSRIETLIKAQSLDEARRMGIIETIIDFFRGGIKRAAIENAYRQIVQFDSKAQGDATQQLGRFQALQGMIKPEHLDQLRIDVEHDPRKQEWSYAFVVANTVVSRADGLHYGDGHEFVAFQDAAMFARTQCVLAKQLSPLADEFDGKDGLRAACAQFNASPGTTSAFETDIANKFAAMAATMIALQAEIPNCPDCVFDFIMQGRDSYELKVNNQPVHRGHFPPPGEDHQKQFIAVVAAAVSADLAYAMQRTGAELNNLDKLIQANVSCMVDTVEASDQLNSKLDDPSFSAANYSGVRDSPDSATFIAMFGKKQLVFSNRAASVREMRGERLKKLLADTEYTNLRDIAGHGHMGAGDTMLYAAARSVSMNLSLRTDDLSPEEIEVLYQSIGDVEVGKTTLGELWQLPEPTSHPARQINDAPFHLTQIPAYA